ncbi:Dicarboxylate transport [Desulfobacula phenolica]|uniref:Dicarboxylate transport n=2 Tax=Desulfobacula phenolica TaxID=90732 RepID=A0A1H2DPN9_9BACT|nr:Dicarboxylate transport [Desulfobacula phenolica]
MFFKKAIKIVFFLFLVFFMVLFFVFLNLPHIVEPKIKEKLQQVLNSKDIEFDIQKIGFSNTVISKIRIGKGIFIDLLNIDYGFYDYDIKYLPGINLPSIHLSEMTVSGLNVHASLDDNNQFEIHGFTIPGTSKDQTRQPDTSLLSFLPKKIVLQNAKIILHAFDDEFLIPFDVLSNLSATDEKIFVRALLYPFGEKLNIRITYDLHKGVEFLKLEGNSFDLEHMNTLLFQKTKGVQLKGPVDFKLVSSSPKKKWDMHISQVVVGQPVEMSVTDVAATCLIDNKKISAGGTFNIDWPMLPLTRMQYSVTLDLKKDHKFDVTLENSKIQHCEFAHGSTLVDIKQPEFKAGFSGTQSKGKGKISLDLKQGRIQNQKQELAFADTKLSLDIDVDLTGKGKGLSSKWMLAANKVKIKSDLVQSAFPLAEGSGVFFFDRNNIPSGNMILKASKGNLRSSKFKIKASGIDFKIPIHYPNTGKRSYGTYFIPAVSYNNQYNFSTRGRIIQTDSKEFRVSGGLDFKTVKDVTAQFNSIVGFEKELWASLDFKINPVKLTYEDIKKMIPQKLDSADIEVTAWANGKADYSNRQLNTSMQVKINDGKIHMPDMKFTATGINTTVDFNDLLVPETVPGQMLTIDSIEANKIRISDAKIRFSLEDASSLLIENIRFKWCNGLVSSESIRFPQKNNAYFLTLYCDRLELTQLLKQMGLFNSQGTGTLNGRIPVIYSDGNIAFDNGFLFSTPGSGGKVMIENAGRITAGIPMDSPQFVQLDIAQEALKDFDYKWAKLIFNSFEDMLYVNMELDGKPSKLLPFEYRKELGGFIRVDASSPGSSFQGIKLDVNLNLPFNEVMKFGNKLKSILN